MLRCLWTSETYAAVGPLANVLLGACFLVLPIGEARSLHYEWRTNVLNQRFCFFLGEQIPPVRIMYRTAKEFVYSFIYRFARHDLRSSSTRI
jgi:hypothetical protein